MTSPKEPSTGASTGASTGEQPRAPLAGARSRWTRLLLPWAVAFVLCVVLLPVQLNLL
ncbi:sensor histidine kinase, partial [Streptomyces sp. SID11233]|nr:sensor histidine kinase [Streptomyces sp. SID11233]